MKLIRDYWWLVPVFTPVGGAWVREEFRVRFRLTTLEELRAAEREPSRPPDAHDEAAADPGEARLDKLLRSLVMDFDGIEGVDGEPLTFSAQNLALLLSMPYVRRALFEAWRDSLLEKSDRVKN